MNYKNANQVLPLSLVKEIQRYMNGGYLYIPVEEQEKTQWGGKSGARGALDCRNREITRKYRSGCSAETLAEEYYLSVHTIRQIVSRFRER